MHSDDKTSFALTPTSFFIVSSSSLDHHPSTSMTILHCSMLHPHGYGFLNSHRRGPYLAAFSSSFFPRFISTAQIHLNCPDLLFLMVQKPCIHSVSLNAGIVSVNRNIPTGLRIRCLAHWFRCYWRVPWGTRVQ